MAITFQTVLPFLVMLGYFSAGSFVVLFLGEYIGARYESNNRPSILITQFATWCAKQWEWFGSLMADISSFYERLKIELILKSFSDLTESFLKLFASPLNVIKGYIKTAERYKYPLLIVIGSLTLLGLVFCGYSYWSVILGWFARFKLRH